MEGNEAIKKLIHMTGERAKLDAKANGTYVVYKDISGNLVKEYSNGTKQYVPQENEHDV